MIISQALKDVMKLEQKIRRGEAILAYWRQWLIDYRKQHPKVEGDPKSDKTSVVKPRTMTGEELASLRKRLELTQREMAFKLEITRQHLSDLDNGKYAISKVILAKVREISKQGSPMTLTMPKPDTETRMKPSSTEAENASPRLSQAQLEKIT
ncbi:MAG: helix-turn-helix domain-containing protein, partial [Thermodesulfobacteriota bacterium]